MMVFSFWRPPLMQEGRKNRYTCHNNSNTIKTYSIIFWYILYVTYNISLTEKDGMLLDVSPSGVGSEELPANRYKIPDDKTRKVQQPFDWVAVMDHNWALHSLLINKRRTMWTVERFIGVTVGLAGKRWLRALSHWRRFLSPKICTPGLRHRSRSQNGRRKSNRTIPGKIQTS